MVKPALTAQPGLMFVDGKEIPRQRGFIDYPGDTIMCRNGHPVKQFAILHEGAMSTWCTFRQDDRQECGEGVYLMGRSRSRTFWAWVTREEVAELAKGLLSVDEILAYFGADGKMWSKKAG